MDPQVIHDMRSQGESGPWGPPTFSELAKTAVLRGPAGEIPIRIITGERVDGAYLHSHGGGFVLGTEDLHDLEHEAMANEAGVAVVGATWFGAHAFPSCIDPTDPDAAPLYADLSSMSPALFTVGTLDPLLDDTLMMAAR